MIENVILKKVLSESSLAIRRQVKTTADVRKISSADWKKAGWSNNWAYPNKKGQPIGDVYILQYYEIRYFYHLKILHENVDSFEILIEHFVLIVVRTI